jgi:hypothetical protein
MAGYKIISASATADGGAAAAPAGNVTGLVITSGWHQDEEKPEVIVRYVKPSPVGTFAAVAVYFEPQDQSNLPEATADGTTLADGTKNAGGDWKPELGAKKKHVDGEPVRFEVDPELAGKTIRVYVTSINTEDVENPLVRANKSGATPSGTVTVALKGQGPQGEEFCSNPTNVAITQNIGVMEGGVRIRHIKTSWNGPKGGDGAYVEVIYKGSQGEEVINVAVGVGGRAENYFPDPKTVQTAKIRFRGFVDNFPGVEDDSVNSYVYLITPELDVLIGTSDGVLDLGEGIAATVAASMSVLNKVLGVSEFGITEDLVATFAISQEKLKNAQIIDAARIVDDAVTNSKIADLAVDTEQLAALAVETSKLNDLAATAAKIGDGAIITQKITDLQVSGPKIADQAVGTAKIELLAVTTALIADASIVTAKIAALAVTSAAIANAAVGTAKIENLAVTTALIANAAITNAKIAALAVASANIQDAAIATAKIADAAITTVKIANAAITNALIANLAVQTAHIADLAVTDGKIASLTVGKLTAGTITLASQNDVFLVVRATVFGQIYETYNTPSGFYLKLGTTPQGEMSHAGSGGLFNLRNAAGAQTISMTGSNGQINAEILYSSDYVRVAKLRAPNLIASGSPAGAATHKLPIYNDAGVQMGHIYVYP